MFLSLTPGELFCLIVVCFVGDFVYPHLSLLTRILVDDMLKHFSCLRRLVIAFNSYIVMYSPGYLSWIEDWINSWIR